jgi:hypothetical protein
MNTIEIIKQYFHESPAKVTTIISIVMVLVILVTSLFQPEKIEESFEHSYLSDQIPDGHILVPIQVINGEALAQMMDLSAYVDLYSVDIIQKRKQILFRKIKIIKNPSDQSSFSILLPEDQGQNLNFLEQPVFAVLKSKKSQLQSVKKVKQPTFEAIGEEI